jgi:guanyl-specific ribonuclease Sa
MPSRRRPWPAAPAASPAPALKAGEPVEWLTLAPNEGREVKATMKAGGEFDYRWATDGAEVRFELRRAGRRCERRLYEL